MNYVLQTISQLRKADSFSIDFHNRNRYRVVVNENDGSKTAYYFSSPIYNLHTRKAVDLKFENKGSFVFAEGSNCTIAVSDSVKFNNAEGSCILSLPHRINKFFENQLLCGSDSIIPSLNGVVYKAFVKDKESVTFELEVGTPFMHIRANDKCFSLMKEEFKPFITVSCIGTVDENGDIVAPAKITYQKLTDKNYSFTVYPCSATGESVLFEVNLYEPKLFQDTTVESMHPTVNNAFGGIAFIGKTSDFGEQWLYSRPDCSKLSELMDKYIESAILYFPKYGHSSINLAAYKVAARFCSFGSNWDNKIQMDNKISDVTNTELYHSVDITSLVVDPITKGFGYSDGFILKPRDKGNRCSIISTGDSYHKPLILQINYRY